jgi:N4-(beta-N-acetylglucosaminyl)-L-asparaginase
MNRRDFVRTAVGATLAAGASRTLLAQQAPNVITPKGAKPVVIASANGNKFKNGGDMTAVHLAFTMMMKGGDVLDALIAGVNITELDPADTSVGYGGLPNAEGVVQLDACCMHGPKKRAGGVACIEGVRTPSNVAQMVMQQTDHHLIVGQGAQLFARNMGFKIEDDLNSPESRKLWLDWKRRIDPDHYLDPEKRAEVGRRALMADGRRRSDRPRSHLRHDQLQRREREGRDLRRDDDEWAAVEDRGRVGDSPILGAGLYVDGEIGAAGSTGRGEANLFGLSSFLIVENMRRGMHPKDAGIDACKRIKANTVEKRLLNSRGEPNFNVNFYALNAKGEYAGVALYPNSNFAVCTEDGPKTLPSEPLLQGKPED